MGTGIEPPAAGKKRKILLVEDEANIASMVQDWLSERYDVVVAGDGKTAVQKAADEQPDLILEDINLPDMLGFDVVKLYQKNPKTSSIPVIFLTGQKMVEETIKFISTEKSVKGYVNKPFKLKEFLDKIELVLGNPSSFVLMEKPAGATQESAQRAQLVRETRKVEAAAEAAEAAPPPPPPAAPLRMPPPPSAAPSSPKAKRGFFRRLISALFRLLFRLLWTALAVGAGAELACRLVQSFAGDWVFLPPVTVAYAPSAPPMLWPGAAWEQGGAAYRINSLGLRDEEPAVTPSTDSFHAAVLSGSALFGQGIPLAGTFSKRLETLLNGTDLFASPGRHVVVNAALWGDSSEDQWTAYENLHPRLKPDVVLWVEEEGRVRRPFPDRLRKTLNWPPSYREGVERSRLVGALEMLYLYGPDGAGAPAPAGDLSGRVNGFLDRNPGAVLLVMKLGKADRLSGLQPRNNLFVFNVENTPGLDVTRTGLTPGGHEVLARTALAVLRQYRDRIRPPKEIAPVPAPPSKEIKSIPAPSPRHRRRNGPR